MQILTKDGFKDFDGFVQSGVSDELVRITLSCGRGEFECTQDHRILMSDGNFIEAGKVRVGDELYGGGRISGLDHLNRVQAVYDAINVKDTHSFRINGGVEAHNCLIMDEFAFVPKNKAEDFWASNYPALAASDESKVIIISTPNGMFNLFHQIYAGAERSTNEFKSMRIDWRRVPGRDKKWAETQRKNLGDVKFNQEFECKFLGSTATVVNHTVLEYLFTQVKEPIHLDLNDRLRIYEHPVEGATYVLGADPSKGTGKHDAAVQVLKIAALKPATAVQVAVFQDNNTDAYTLAAIINRLSIYYNNANIICENNGEGSATVGHLWWHYENGNLYNSGNKSGDIGLRSTTRTKPKAVILMKKLIEDGRLMLFDRETVKQLSAFIEDGRKFRGKDLPDDLVDALFWATFVFDLNILEETAEIIEMKGGNDEDVWGILADVPEQEEWDWLNG
jgi:hypothetical protein